MKNWVELKSISYMTVSILFSSQLTSYSCSMSSSRVERPMVIVTASYNNKQWYQKNLDSIFSQNYTNYRLIYIDDCSSDGTADLVAEYVKAVGQEHRVTLIRNKERKLAMHNLYDAIISCADDEIVAIVDGDDFLAHPRVLKIINRTYSDATIWLAYSQFKMWKSGMHGWGTKYPRPVLKSNAFREFRHTPTHLRTFYAWLFKKIDKNDLFYDNDFFKMTYDMAMMLPMIEMARNNYAFIPSVLYIYNDSNPISDHKVNQQLQRDMDRVIRGRKKYEALM